MIPASTGVAHRDLSSPGVTYQQAVRFAERQICLESGSLPGCDGSRAICPNPMGLRRSRLVEHLQVVAAVGQNGRPHQHLRPRPRRQRPGGPGGHRSPGERRPPAPPGRRRLRKRPPGRRPGSGLGRWTGRARPLSVGAGKCPTASAPTPASGSAAPEWPSRPGSRSIGERRPGPGWPVSSSGWPTRREPKACSSAARLRTGPGRRSSGSAPEAGWPSPSRGCPSIWPIPSPRSGHRAAGAPSPARGCRSVNRWGKRPRRARRPLGARAWKPSAASSRGGPAAGLLPTTARGV